jgi:hypothetical protein
MSRAVKEANFSSTKIRSGDCEAKVGGVRIKESISADKELYQISSLCSSDCRCRLIPTKHDLVLNRLWFDISVVQTVWYNSVYLCHINN